MVSSASAEGIAPLPKSMQSLHLLLQSRPVLLSILWESRGNVQSKAGLAPAGVMRVPSAGLCALSRDAELLWPPPQGQGFGFAE